MGLQYLTECHSDPISPTTQDIPFFDSCKIQVTRSTLKYTCKTKILLLIEEKHCNGRHTRARARTPTHTYTHSGVKFFPCQHEVLISSPSTHMKASVVSL